MKNNARLSIAFLFAVAFSFAACWTSPKPTQNVSPTSVKTVQSPKPTPKQTPTPSMAKLELSEAISKGLVRVTGSGNGLETISISIESKSDESLELAIQSGTIFKALSGSTQSMVTREEVTVVLGPRGSKVSISIDAACANMYLNTPDEDDKFAVRKTPASDDLKKLLALSEFRREDFRVQQFAIWTITDNPSREGYVGIGEFGLGSGPDKDELQRIRTLFEKAEISTEKYRALR
jgi:starvation-inducible outer membrane lipoprotein